MIKLMSFIVTASFTLSAWPRETGGHHSQIRWEQNGPNCRIYRSGRPINSAPAGWCVYSDGVDYQWIQRPGRPPECAMYTPHRRGHVFLSLTTHGCR